MTPTAVITELARRGIVLTANGGKLSVNVQRGKLAPNVRAYLAEYKALLLAALQDPGAECGAIYDEWCTEPTNTSYATKYASAATAAGLGFTTDTGECLGGDAARECWRQWTAEISQGASPTPEPARPAEALTISIEDWPDYKARGFQFVGPVWPNGD